MTQSIISLLHPYLITILQAALVGLVGVIGTYVLQGKEHFLKWLRAHTTAKQRDTLHRLGEEAFAFAKTVYIDHDGPSKLAAAVAYFSSRLEEIGIDASTDEIRAAIEKAYLAYQAITTQPIATDTAPIIVGPPQVIEKPIAPEVQQLLDAAKVFSSTQSTFTEIPKTVSTQN